MSPPSLQKRTFCILMAWFEHHEKRKTLAKALWWEIGIKPNIEKDRKEALLSLQCKDSGPFVL